MNRHLKDQTQYSPSPTFRDPLHVGRPNVGNEDALVARIKDILSGRRLTNGGPYVEEFERRLAQRVGVDHCVAVCNATAGLSIVLKALGLTGEVIVPSFTFVGTVHALRWLGLKPVFCDVDPHTHNIDPKQVELLVTPQTSAIVGVHLWGRGCDVATLEQIAARHGLALVLDAAHAFACSHDGKTIGGFGQAEVFSFHATKVMNTFEGGAISTNDGRLADQARLMRNFGFADTDTIISLGTNAKMSEVGGAMGLTSLESLDSFVEASERNHGIYYRRLNEIPGFTVIRQYPGEAWNYHYVVVEVDREIFGVDRNMLLHALRAEGVLARRYFFPGCHRVEPYRAEARGTGHHLPETDRLCRRVLQLPTGAAIGRPEVEGICDIIARIVDDAPPAEDVRARPAYD